MYRLSATGGRAGAWFLKWHPSGLECALLRHLAALDTGVPTPTIAAWLRPTAGGSTPTAVAGWPPTDPEAAPANPAVAVCLTRMPGSTLAHALHAGAAIPVDAWGRAMADTHLALRPAVRGDVIALACALPILASAGVDVAERLPRWMTVAARYQTADAYALLGQVFSAVPALAGQAEAEAPFAPLVVCHGAWTPDHLVVEHGEVTGGLDWEHARIAPAGYDLATAVTGLFQQGVSARAALALGDALAAAYAAESGRKPHLMAFYLVLEAAERLLAAVERRAQGRGGGDVQAWSGLLVLALARAGQPG